MKNSELRALYDQAMLPVYSPPPPVLSRGAGSRVWDCDGWEYVDFGGGIAVLSLGHAPPEVAEAVARQAKKLTHTSNLHASEEAILTAQVLRDSTFAEAVFFCNSGAEANEAALKLARRRGVQIRPDKYRVLAFDNSFHGRIGLSMAATGQERIREGFGPLAPGFSFAPFNDLAAAKKQTDDDVCAIIVEPIQGEGGVVPAAEGFLRGLRELADSADALLIFDEIQTGAGRCGELFAYMGEKVVPDILTAAKGLGAGFPAAAMLAGESAAAALPKGGHGSTFGGNPLAMAAMRAALSAFLADGFMDGVRQRGEEFASRLRALDDELHCFADVRGRGLLVGCPMREGWKAESVSAAALAEGLIVITAGGNVLRLAPALNIPASDIEEGFARLKKALAASAP